MQTGVGHYGVFSSKTWQQQIYPMVKNVILQNGIGIDMANLLRSPP
jgi:poly(3-hydroxybutyrate) depolymerase